MSRHTKKPAKTTRTKTTNNQNIADAIANVASSSSPAPPPKKSRSRFFFRVDKEDTINIREEDVPVNSDLVKATDDAQSSLPARMAPLVNDVRDFFVNELAPLTLAGITGAQQARAALAEVLGVEVDATTEVKFRSLLARAIDIKLASYVKNYMNLSEDEATLLLDTLKPRNPANLVLPLSGHENTNRRPINKKDQKEKETQNRGSGRRRSPRPRLEEEDDLP